ncbi:5-dehydro-2-deoxygluconokinase [Anaerococcus porci]|uniref:5-dehydro-2-deoxygluconokinase n=1 Tax=Anaerococcus porci TaxID=2652269 RepID=UPI002A75BE87|nr:5-dehydro-2-deoxygluconokinase [Anaerococcus porci]MDY3007386.1 5-dehydro-2-deoxygluconokinase [Anaerococcus porci]
MKYIDFPKDRDLDLILIGRVAVDFNPSPEEGFKPLSQVVKFERYIGGSTVNTAIGVNRHGLKVGLIAKISDDQLGDFCLDYLNNEKNIDTSHISRAKNGEKIGLTFTEMKSENESSILMYRNMIADLALDVDDIDYDYIKKAKAILVSGTALAESPSREAVLKAISFAKRAGCKVIFDIDFRNYNWKNKDEISIYYSIVARQSDIIMGSREEFDLTEKLIVDKSLNDEESAKLWFKEKAEILVIKHGKRGSNAYVKNGESYSIKPFPIKARKGFGGGDGYASAFLYSLFDGKEIIECLEYASAEASMMIRSNSSSDLPNTEELEEFIRESKKEYGEFVARGDLK